MISDYLTVAFLVFGGLVYIIIKYGFRKITDVSFNGIVNFFKFLNYFACFEQVYIFPTS